MGMMPRNDTGDAAMPSMHDDYLPADPRIPQNRGARRGREPPVTTEFYRVGLWSGQQAYQDGPGGAITATAPYRWPWLQRASEGSEGSTLAVKEYSAIGDRSHQATFCHL